MSVLQTRSVEFRWRERRAELTFTKRFRRILGAEDANRDPAKGRFPVLRYRQDRFAMLLKTSFLSHTCPGARCGD